MVKKMTVILIVAVLISATAGFAAGYFLKAGDQGAGGFSARGMQFGAQGQGAPGQRRAGANNFGSARGIIISKDESSITLKLNDGGSANVFYSGATRISKSSDAGASDLEPDVEVSAMGTKNSDGSIAAQSIQIGGGFGQPGGMGGIRIRDNSGAADNNASQ